MMISVLHGYSMLWLDISIDFHMSGYLQKIDMSGQLYKIWWWCFVCVCVFVGACVCGGVLSRHNIHNKGKQVAKYEKQARKRMGKQERKSIN